MSTPPSLPPNESLLDSSVFSLEELVRAVHRRARYSVVAVAVAHSDESIKSSNYWSGGLHSCLGLVKEVEMRMKKMFVPQPVCTQDPPIGDAT